MSDLSKMLSGEGYDTVVLNSHSVRIRPAFLASVRPYAAWRIGREINRRCKEDDIVFCNGYFSWNARRNRSLVVYHGTERGRAERARIRTGALRRLLVRTFGAHLDRKAGIGRRVVAVSPEVGREIEEYYGHKVDAVIFNSVDLTLFRPRSEVADIRKRFNLPADKFLVLFVGPPDTRKGIDLVEQKICPNLKDGQHMVIRSEVNERPRNSTVIGRLSQEDLARLYSACDVLLLPSEYEGCSITLAEALASGLPVIASDTGSATDLKGVQGLEPYVVAGANPREYLTRIDRLAKDAEERRRVSIAARRYAETIHDPGRFLESYKQVLAESSRGADAKPG